MQMLKNIGRTAFSALLCLALLAWSIAPASNHAPSVFDVIADHREMVAEHGHSHGFKEDLEWALHGHSHDVADHDHSPAVLAIGTGSVTAWGHRDSWHIQASLEGPHRIYMIERPPRV
ncbi:MAG: hypothetical protein IKD58_07390 [Loktanella sp.]|nr:hypothetical protein [Loktanella sp.]